MEYTLEQEDNTCVLTLEGELGIQNAGELKIAISGILDTCPRVEVNLAHISQIDLSCIQVLCAANRSFEKNKKIFKKKSGNRKIRDRLIQLGFFDNKGYTEGPCVTCFWKGEEK